MITRRYTRLTREKLATFPAVALLGPRQCGKTTLARQLGGNYFDLENEGHAARLDAEWDVLVAGKRLLVLDEAQRAPWVFARLRGAIDADRKRNGRFLLLGSVSPALMENVSESLAGRLGLVCMSPLILPELKVGQLDDLWLRGGYPDGGIIEPAMFPGWQRDYLEVLATRDLPLWGLPAKPQTTRRLMQMLAVQHGQPWNASQIGASLALDHKTVSSYSDYLEGAFLIRRLPPFFANTRKRLVKAPRVYWRDSGLLHSLMGVTSFDQLYQQPWLGASWEGYVIEQTLASLDAAGKQVIPYYFRTSDGHELDLVLDHGREQWAVEVKLTSNPTRGMLDQLMRTAALVPAKRAVLVCRVARKFANEKLLVTNLPGWLRELTA
jgi:uncharacterized protein